MITIIHILNILLPILYAALVSAYWVDFKSETRKFAVTRKVGLYAILVIHFVYIMLRTVEFNHPPITTKFEIFTVLAFSVCFSYAVLEQVTDIRKTGAFILLMSLAFQLVSTFFINDLMEVPEVLRSRLLGMHVVAALLGYAGISISAVYGLLYLTLHKRIKKSSFGLFFDRLPSLELLEKLSFNSLMIGFVMLTVAIMIGGIWLPAAFPDFSYMDPKLVSTGIVWAFYGSGTLISKMNDWYGKKVIWFSLIGFVLSMFSLVLSIFISNSFHNFD